MEWKRVLLYLLSLYIASAQKAVTVPISDILGDVLHMERLQFGDRNKLIVSSQDVIWTVNTQTAETELLAGVRGTTGFQDVEPLNGEPYPLFNTVRGFIVLNETHLLLADTNNHCLRFLNMLTSATSTYAGECTQMGQEDGYLKEQARFNKPTVIIRQEFFLFYILDQGSSRVRSIDWRESPRNRVHTYRVLEPYAKLADHQISSMIFSGSDYAFISHRKQGIARFSRSTNDLLEEKDVELLTSGIQGQVDGEISTAQFGVVLDIAFLHGTDEVLIVLDEWNQPRYINLTEGLVYPGNQSLTFNTPICVLSMEECVYIGGSFGIQCTHPDDIRGLLAQGLPTTTTTTTTVTAPIPVQPGSSSIMASFSISLLLLITALKFI